MTTEPPYADPLVRWCGRAEPVRVPPMPIVCFFLSFFLSFFLALLAYLGKLQPRVFAN